MDLPLPKQLLKIKPSVGKLYYKGDLQKGIFNRCVAVVGARRMTSYSERVLEKLIPPLVEAGITIVSGFMYGVDKTAHKLALECGGRTIAVLGWGIDWGKEKLEKNLLFMSEYEGETKSQLWMFPRRNRIVAGLSQAILVVEAAAKSGSLITAQFALKYKRKLFAVPGPITSKTSEGTNALIKNGLAEMAVSADDLLASLGCQVTRTVSVKESGNKIIDLLGNEPLSVDEIARKTGRTVEEVGVELSLLQLKGKILEDNGKYFPN